MEEELQNPEESWNLWAKLRYPIGWKLQCGVVGGGDPPWRRKIVDLMMVGTWVMKMVSGGCRVVVGGNDPVVVRQQHRRRCSFTSRLAWEASRYRATMGLLTWWRSRSQLATFPIEPSSTPSSSSLSCCPLSLFSLLLLPLKVSTSAPHSVLLFFFLLPIIPLFIHLVTLCTYFFCIWSLIESNDFVWCM